MASNVGTYSLTIGDNPVVTGSMTVSATIDSSGTVTFTCSYTLNALPSGYYWNYGIKVQARDAKYDSAAGAWGAWTGWGNKTLVAENTSTWSKITGSYKRTVTGCTKDTNARTQFRFSYVDSTIGVVGPAQTHASDIVTLTVAKGDNVTAVSKSPNQTYHIDGDSITVTATPATGHTAKWTSNNTGTSGVANSSSNPYTFNIKDAESVTLTASATPNTYTIKYNANGGSGSMSNTTGTYGVESTLRKNTFTKTGYRFVGWTAYRAGDKKWYYKGTTNGWYTEAAAPSGYTKYIYKDEQAFAKLTSVQGDTITMYAQWEIGCYVYIDNGSSFDKYLIYIDNGTSWDLYAPYIDNGTSWDPYG